MGDTCADLAGIEATQAEFMKKDLCILVDRHDTPIGCATKQECHLVSAILSGTALHRAFSVFLFNSRGELLLQQRAKDKVTFAERWTNTCCSHPIFNTSDAQEEEPNTVRRSIGTKIAAVRKIEQELGITELKVEDLHFLTRIHYCATSDQKWGEHEIDHILFARCADDIRVVPNPNEVGAIRWVSQSELSELFQQSITQPTLLTPWFKLIGEEFLLKDWWPRLDEIIEKDGIGVEEKEKIYVLTQKGNAATNIPDATPGLKEHPNIIERAV